MRRRLAVAAVVAAALAVAPAASAHSRLDRSSPPNGGLVGVGRSSVDLWFSEEINRAGSRFDLSSTEGKRLRIRSRVHRNGFVELTTGRLREGTYRLAWSVTSIDGHPTTGTIVFGAGRRPTIALTGTSQLPAGPTFLSRWFDLGTLMLAIGGTATYFRTRRRRAAVLGLWGATGAVIAGVITPFLQLPRGDAPVGEWLRATLQTLAETTWGHVWIGRQLGVAVAASSLAVLLRSQARGRAWLASSFLALAIAVTFDAWAGHASSLPRQSWVAVAAMALHLASAGVWAGGLLVIVVLLVTDRRFSLSDAWSAFAPLAITSTVILLATGLYEAGRELPSIASIGSTVYGGTVAAKVVLLVVAISFAAVNTLRVRRGSASAGVVPLMAAELAVLVLAVAAAALLTSVPTSRELAAAPTPRGPAAASTQGMFVTFEQLAAGPDRSRLVARTQAIVHPQPGPLTGVEAFLRGPGGTTRVVRLARTEPGRYEATTESLVPGTWRVALAVQRTDSPDAYARLLWTVEQPPTDAAGAVEIAATVTAILLLATLAAILLRGRSRRTPRLIETSA